MAGSPSGMAATAVAASTQRQALNAIVFLYRDVLHKELGDTVVEVYESD